MGYSFALHSPIAASPGRVRPAIDSHARLRANSSNPIAEKKNKKYKNPGSDKSEQVDPVPAKVESFRQPQQIDQQKRIAFLLHPRAGNRRHDLGNFLILVVHLPSKMWNRRWSVRKRGT